MRRQTSPLITILIAVLLAGISAAGVISHPQPPTPGDSATEQVIATVRTVDVQGSALEVIDGVGHALRSVQVQVAPACRIQEAGHAVGLGDVEAGMVVRMGCRKVADRLVAESIEVVSVKTGDRH